MTKPFFKIGQLITATNLSQEDFSCTYIVVEVRNLTIPSYFTYLLLGGPQGDELFRVNMKNEEVSKYYKVLSDD